MADLKKLHETIVKELRLRTDPVGVKLFKELNQIPSNIARVPDKLTVCQLSTLARLHGLTYYATVDDIACRRGAGSIGLRQISEDDCIVEDAYTHTVNVEAARKLYSFIPMLPPNSTKAILMGPLGELTINPDAVLVVGNPGQMLKVVEGYVWSRGEPLTLSSTGVHGVCGDGIAKALKTGKISLSFPCGGARRVGLYIDEEMVAVIPFSIVDEWIDGLISTRKTGHPYPIPTRIVWNPPPPAHKPLKP
jgi:uncharacterized protein (DUF169 family)